jgi:hypothetical protein
LSNDPDSLKDTPISRRGLLKLIGAGSLFVGMGALGISNFLKTASAIMNNSNIISNDTSKLNMSQDIRPFRVNVPEAELIELRRRINATRFPEPDL